MSRTDPRPQCWKVQGEIPHQQYRAWIQMRNQANFRGEAWDLSFEQFQTAWHGKWDQRGRETQNYCLARIEDTAAWSPENVECITRLVHLRAQAQRRVGKPRKPRKRKNAI